MVVVKGELKGFWLSLLMMPPIADTYAHLLEYLYELTEVRLSALEAGGMGSNPIGSNICGPVV